MKWCSGQTSPLGGYGGLTGNASWVPNHLASTWEDNTSSAKVVSSYLNGSKVKGTIDGHALAAATTFRTGGYNANYPGCRIYSMRLYDRILSDDEIAYNYSQDRIRFNLP